MGMKIPDQDNLKTCRRQRIIQYLQSRVHRAMCSWETRMEKAEDNRKEFIRKRKQFACLQRMKNMHVRLKRLQLVWDNMNVRHEVILRHEAAHKRRLTLTNAISERNRKKSLESRMKIQHLRNKTLNRINALKRKMMLDFYVANAQRSVCLQDIRDRARKTLNAVSTVQKKRAACLSIQAWWREVLEDKRKWTEFEKEWIFSCLRKRPTALEIIKTAWRKFHSLAYVRILSRIYYALLCVSGDLRCEHIQTKEQSYIQPKLLVSAYLVSTFPSQFVAFSSCRPDIAKSAIELSLDVCRSFENIRIQRVGPSKIVMRATKDRNPIKAMLLEFKNAWMAATSRPDVLDAIYDTIERMTLMETRSSQELKQPDAKMHEAIAESVIMEPMLKKYNDGCRDCAQPYFDSQDVDLDYAQPGSCSKSCSLEAPQTVYDPPVLLKRLREEPLSCIRVVHELLFKRENNFDKSAPSVQVGDRDARNAAREQFWSRVTDDIEKQGHKPIYVDLLARLTHLAEQLFPNEKEINRELRSVVDIDYLQHLLKGGSLNMVDIATALELAIMVCSRLQSEEKSDNSIRWVKAAKQHLNDLSTVEKLDSELLVGFQFVYDLMDDLEDETCIKGFLELQEFIAENGLQIEKDYFASYFCFYPEREKLLTSWVHSIAHNYETSSPGKSQQGGGRFVVVDWRRGITESVLGVLDQSAHIEEEDLPSSFHLDIELLRQVHQELQFSIIVVQLCLLCKANANCIGVSLDDSVMLKIAQSAADELKKKAATVFDVIQACIKIVVEVVLKNDRVSPQTLESQIKILESCLDKSIDSESPIFKTLSKRCMSAVRIYVELFRKNGIDQLQGYKLVDDPICSKAYQDKCIHLMRLYLQGIAVKINRIVETHLAVHGARYHELLKAVQLPIYYDPNAEAWQHPLDKL